MQGFIDTQREEPAKEEVGHRLQHFDEIYAFFNSRMVARQGERCVQCGDPFCAALGCPLQNPIPQWLEAVADKDLHKAFLLANESSPFPEILGRVCPHNRLCEGACTLDDGYGAISIGAIEASLTDLGFDAGYRLPFPGVSGDASVGIIGSGPAGMSCAHFLLRAGVRVTMYERADLPGGLLTYGIPGFKLDKELVRRRFGILKKAGLELHCDAEVGVDVTVEELLQRHTLLFFGVGATDGKKAAIPHEEHPQVFMAMEFLTNVQRRLLGKSSMERFGVLGKRVVVIGGGDTAMDCVRTAVREGAQSVTCLYRRDESNMPGSRKEFHNAVEEGVNFVFHEAPTAVVLDDAGDLVGIDMIATRLGEPDASGRRRVEMVEGSEHCVPADVVILALGFDTGGLPFLRGAGVKLGQWGEVVIDPQSGRTNQARIFAGGDCQRGADLVVTAAADGRQAAKAMLAELFPR